MNGDLVLSGRKRDLGGFTVSRVLPNAKRRQVGPFVFLDHMGPMQIDSTHVLDVRPHPHIGLSTVTYLFEGRGYHRDSLGSKQVITPGDLNWMTAGKGIVHSERTPEEDRDPAQNNSVHGIQIWVGLPVEHEDCEPSFSHYPKQELPVFKVADGLSGKLLIGSYQNVQSPVKTYSRAFFADLRCEGEIKTQLGFQEQELALFLVEGSAKINGQTLKVDDIVVVADPTAILLEATRNTRLIVVGGQAFPEPRYIWWNFVSSQKQKIRDAAERWRNQAMGQVPGETERIPLPQDPLP